MIKRVKTFLSNSAGDPEYFLLTLLWKIRDLIIPRRIIKCGGTKFTLSCENWITHWRWYLFKNRSENVRLCIYKYMKDGDVFFDIGANIGVFSLYAAKEHPHSKIYAFEPEPSNAAILKENIIRNNLKDQIEFYNFAIGNKTEISYLHLQDYTPGAACHTISKNNITLTDEGYQAIGRIGVALYTLDDFCKCTGIVPNVLKIDTDGHEVKVLQGAQEILFHHDVKMIVMENPIKICDFKECCKILEGAGFKLEVCVSGKGDVIWIKNFWF